MGAMVRLEARRVLVPAGVGIVVAMLLMVAVSATTFADAHLATLLGYLCVWVPLLAAIVVAGAYAYAGQHGLGAPETVGRLAGGIRSMRSLLRLSFRPIDLIWGLAIGLLARTLASLVEVWGYGSIGTAGATFDQTVYDFWWLFGALLAPVLLAPVVEELFFRGLVLRAVYGQVATSRVPSTGKSRQNVPTQSGRGSTPWAAPLAIGVSGLTFALMHLVTIDAGSTAVIVVVGVSTLIFGLAAASVSLATGRIGGAIVAHVTFNGLVMVPALLSL
ncbi:CPBP family glutamic-type intramembrane protease [Cryobacterium sp. PH31-O1]|uniref:CPBP family glutamic-type intramembrane protease n=1 Tax=Cryobacterium sp. PH31-O1 TaxID=3046306 RepID=UPI0024B94182|nr:CPBP family glutamic-type intramembrane protease [Cryobacterium sp. PH31-O1]MDJ0338408.1 CPBP family glutamic-type intramembrane protease [Cryobacterium sp. PH31-O1]